jgi:hypothetical protein
MTGRVSGTRGSAMALVQSQQFTGNGLRFVLRPLLFLGQESKESGRRMTEVGLGSCFPRSQNRDLGHPAEGVAHRAFFKRRVPQK